MKVRMWIEDRETGHIVLSPDACADMPEATLGHLLLLDDVTIDELLGCADVPSVLSGDGEVVIFRRSSPTEREIDHGGGQPGTDGAAIPMPCGDWIVHRSWDDWRNAPYGE